MCKQASVMFLFWHFFSHQFDYFAGVLFINLLWGIFFFWAKHYPIFSRLFILTSRVYQKLLFWSNLQKHVNCSTQEVTLKSYTGHGNVSFACDSQVKSNGFWETKALTPTPSAFALNIVYIYVLSKAFWQFGSEGTRIFVLPA